MNYSLLRYPGGKSRAVKILSQYVPEKTKEICSPFFGGGSFEIYLATIGIEIYGYDIYFPLVAFWDSVLNNRIELVNKIKDYYPLSKEDFYFLQNSLPNIGNYTKIGAVFYVLNRSSFSGTTMSGGMSPNHPRFTLQQINRIENFSIQFSIDCLSFEASIPLHPNCLIYADPPYFINQSLYGDKGNMHKRFNHLLLAEILNARGHFILSYNNCEEIKDLYYSHKFIYPTWSYGMGNPKNSKELLIISKDENL